MRGSRTIRRRILAVVPLLAAGLVVTGPDAAGRLDDLRITVLSNRADLISAGDALVEIALPDRLDPDRVRVTTGKRDLTDAFAVRPGGRFMGLVTGLPLGRSVLTAKARGSSGQVTVTNHPNSGPVFSGPQIQPWACQPTAVDPETCDQPAEYELLYKSSNPLEPGFKPYDEQNPPSDVEQTTTDQGVTVPFIVRVETGYADRDQYKIATLFQPGKDWQPWDPQEQWNNKVLITHGTSCGASYGSGQAPSVLSHTISTGTVPVDELGDADSVPAALGRGFAVMSTALNHNGHNCNIVPQAESMMMAKEHIVETYGEIRYTIGTGCSGGSVTQQQVANAYPGIYQGLIVTCSYPDTLTPGAQFADYHLLRKYFEDPSKWSMPWLPTQMAAVEGHLSHLNAVTSDEGLFIQAVDPTAECAGISDDQRYHPQDNPGGVRCSVLDYMINVLGPRDESVWSDNERELGRGFAGIPLGNTGIQYGLEALEDGLISPEQFVDLNAKIGGLNVDIQPQPDRTAADRPAIRNAYRSGAINDASNLDQVAIIDHGGPDPGAAHDARLAWVMRDRIDREHGTFANHVIWFGHAPIFGDPSYPKQALLAMDRWLAGVEADTSTKPAAEKIRDERPKEIVDRCSNVDGVELVEVPGYGPVCELGLLQTRLSTPREVAGDHFTSDTHECRLQPLRRNAYQPVTFTDAQWQRLQDAFPTGVCDYGRQGVGQVPTVGWLTYSDDNGDVVYGGRPLPPAPAHSGTGLASPAFGS